MTPNTIAELLKLISEKRLPPASGNKRFQSDISADTPYVDAYHIPKMRNMEPAAIRNIPASAIDLLIMFQLCQLL